MMQAWQSKNNLGFAVIFVQLSFALTPALSVREGDLIGHPTTSMSVILIHSRRSITRDWSARKLICKKLLWGLKPQDKRSAIDLSRTVQSR
jgi:hypothetical protein